ncbi:hypothetical protein ACGFX8_37470 [Streptomyces sp. NPDC048362]|uniref:hypothetical protein n=1 Tax=Streptomyces sp. NPDC048362 TaxID=3365539 RepID=UPI003720193E
MSEQNYEKIIESALANAKDMEEFAAKKEQAWAAYSDLKSQWRAARENNSEEADRLAKAASAQLTYIQENGYDVVLGKIED